VSVLLSALAQWAAGLTNGLLSLDATARTRLSKLDGRCIRLETGADDDTVTIRFERGAVRIDDRADATPSVIVQGAPPVLLEALVRGNLGAGQLKITGDEVLLQEFVAILRDTRPDLEAPLARLVGERSAQNLVGFMEYGINTLGRIVGDIGREGDRFARAQARRRFVDRGDLDHLFERQHAAQLRIDRIAARLDRLDDDHANAERAPP
jgi:ubiquinone biosynthesis protein UbiJ